MSYYSQYLQIINESRSYYGNAGAGIIVVCTSTKKVLLCLRSEEIDYEPGTWSYPGGKIDEKDTNVLQAALREFREETGKNLKRFESILFDEFKAKNFKYTTYIIFVDKEFDISLNWENEDYGWFTIDEIKTMNIHFGLKRLIPKIKRVIFKEYKNEI